MVLHKNLVIGVIYTLDNIFNNKIFADKAIEKTLKSNKKWGSKDRGFIAETCYEIVRWKRLYSEIANLKSPYNSNELWKFFSVWAVLRGLPIPNWKEFENIPKRKIKGKFDHLSKIRKFRESIPNWLDKIGLIELGEKKWEKELSELNKSTSVVLRTNTHKITRNQLKKILINEGIETNTIKKYPNALILKKRCNLFLRESFKKGLYELQDASSQLVAPFLNVEKGMRVCDVCAGAGGKTLHLSCLMENKGKIIAMDINQFKLNELRKRSKRNGAFNIQTKLIDNLKSVKKLYGKFDRLLIDAPCSGLGVLKRNPDAKWKLNLDFMQRVREKQLSILKKYSPLVKKGGKLVYATCSILPSENEMQIKKFLKSEEGKIFDFEDENKINPSDGFDGFYMARLALKQTC
ncbi:MAG: RNA methyltransferase [Flavobacteriaceae bacterium]|nr:RNA methyltransferase [Flavobacteriaceae bacterium]